MKPWAVRAIAVLFVLGLVLSIALSSALPLVVALCLSGVLAAGEIHSRR